MERTENVFKPDWGRPPIRQTYSPTSEYSSFPSLDRRINNENQATIVETAKLDDDTCEEEELRRKKALLRLRELSHKYVSPNATTEEIRIRTAEIAEEAVRKRAERRSQKDALQGRKSTFKLPSLDAQKVRDRLPSIKKEDVERLRQRLNKLHNEDVRNMRMRLQEGTASRVSVLIKTWTSCCGFDAMCGSEEQLSEHDEASRRFELLEKNIDFVLREEDIGKVKMTRLKDDESSFDDLIGSSFETRGTESSWDDDDDDKSLDSLELAFMELSRGETAEKKYISSSKASPPPRAAASRRADAVTNAKAKVRKFARQHNLDVNPNDFLFRADWPDSY